MAVKSAGTGPTIAATIVCAEDRGYSTQQIGNSLIQGISTRAKVYTTIHQLDTHIWHMHIKFHVDRLSFDQLNRLQ